MAWGEEWAQLKADALARQQGGMQLNGVPDSGSGPGGTGGWGIDATKDLVVRDDELGRLGNLAFDLRERLSKDADHARPSTFRAAITLQNEGLETGPALTELHDAWNSQARTLLDACAHVSNHLDFTRSQHAKDEDDIATSIQASVISGYIK